MFDRFPRTKQHDRSDCGAACLNSIARHYGLRFPISRIRQFAGTGREGTTVLGVIDAATRMGLQAKGVRAGHETLAQLPKPAIAHLVLANGLHHFVVIWTVTRRYIGIMDPAEGRLVRHSHDEFRDRWTGVLVLLAPATEFHPRDETQSPALRFWRLLQPHRSVMAQALVGATAYTILGLSTAIYVEKIVDHVLVDRNGNLLNLLSVGMIVLLVVQVYIGWAKGVLTLRTGQKIDAGLVLGYYRHLLKLPQSFFDAMRIGELVSRVGDAVRIRSFVNDVALDLVVNLLVLVFSLTLMGGYSWRLALMVMMAIPLYAMIFQYADRVNRRTLRLVMEGGAELESHLVSSLGAISTIKRFGVEAATDLETERRFVRLLRPVYRAGISSIFSSGASDFVSKLLTIAVLWAGSTLVIRNELTPGELMSFYALVGYLTGPATRLVNANRTIQDALIACDRLFEIMDLEREGSAAPKVRLPMGSTPALSFEAVHFRYGGRSLVFDGLTLHIDPGRMTAIVGESGSGKSTLMALAQNLYPLAAGRVAIGGYDVRVIDAESLNGRLAAVPQDIHLFAGNVIENVALGDPEPDLARLLDVCGRLGVSSFVERLPQGFHTPLGENGVSLSGGERQRLAIARALYRDPDILILDEATSSLDSGSEGLVHAALRRLRHEGKTIVLIAHRLSTVVTADQIVVLEEGRVSATGRHEELMRGGGLYSRLWRAQHPMAGGDDFSGLAHNSV